MKARSVVAILFVYAVLIMSSAAADNTADGQWEAKVKTQVGEQTIRMNLKSDGNALTGTVSDGRSGQTTIEDGKIDGVTLSFKQTVDLGGNSISFTYTGKINGDQIVFTREPFKLEFTAKRVK